MVFPGFFSASAKIISEQFSSFQANTSVKILLRLFLSHLISCAIFDIAINDVKRNIANDVSLWKTHLRRCHKKCHYSGKNIYFSRCLSSGFNVCTLRKFCHDAVAAFKYEWFGLCFGSFENQTNQMKSARRWGTSEIRFGAYIWFWWLKWIKFTTSTISMCRSGNI